MDEKQHKIVIFHDDSRQGTHLHGCLHCGEQATWEVARYARDPIPIPDQHLLVEAEAVCEDELLNAVTRKVEAIKAEFAKEG